MTFDTTGLTERKNKFGTIYFENDDGIVINKKCRKCGKVKHIVMFNKSTRGLGGSRPECKQCTSKIWRNYYEVRRDDILKTKKIRRKLYPEYDINYRIITREERHTEKLNRRARERSLKNTLTTEQKSDILTVFNGGCSLTGKRYTWDHVIPISIGHGGTSLENMIPLRADLNFSKRNNCIFDWFADNCNRFGLEQRRFDELITYLADINGMTEKEYEEYVRWCHDNPRTLDEIKAEQEDDEASA